MRILKSGEVREAISRSEADAQVLLQRAGYAVAQFCASQFKFRSVCVVCGKGNNGGAGLSAAGALRRVAEKVYVIVLAKEASELSPHAAACLQPDAQPIWISDAVDFEADTVREALDADLIVDAIVATGFRPPLRGLAKRAVQAINDASGTIVSVDLPSGVDADSEAPIDESGGNIVFAHGIVALIAPKPAHVFGELTSGPIAVSEIGVQPALVANETGLDVITGREVRITFPPRSNDAHKGEFGHVLVIAGSLGKAGAACLTALAAACTGAGMVTVACPKSIQATVAGFSPSLMTAGLAETDEGTISMKAGDQMDRLLAGKDVVVLGPGLSRHEETAAFVRHLVAICRLPLVLDADGLNAFEGYRSELKADGAASQFRVLTLHPGKAGSLTRASTSDVQADRPATARRISREIGCCVVLKGRRTVVAGASGETWINMSGNPALAKAGSGNVLSGIIGAALARRSGSSRDESANAEDRQLRGNIAFLKDLNVAAAVHLHGIAGDIARDALHENTVLPTDLVEALADAFRECQRQVDQGLFYLHK